MGSRALRCALALWMHEARWMAAASALFFVAAGVLGGLALLGLRGAPLLAPLLFLPLWHLAALLVRSVGQLERGARASKQVWRLWLRDGWRPRLAMGAFWALSLTAVGATVLLRSQGRPVPEWALALSLGGLAWVSSDALTSLGLDVPLEQESGAAQKAGFLAAPAFLPSTLLTLGLAAWCSGAAFWLDLGGSRWIKPLLYAPVLFAPFFTPSFFAAYLYFLAQGIKDRSQGKEPLPGAPTLGEIFRPWR
jgi:hypothetical protein